MQHTLASLLFVAVAVSHAMAAQPQAPPAATEQPVFTTLKSDFVPGEKTIFFDDFTDMAAGDAPPHFKVRGVAPELKAAGSLRQLTVTQRNSLLPNLTALPGNFTYEAEIKFDVTGRASVYLALLTKAAQTLVFGAVVRPTDCELQVQVRVPKYADLGRKRLPLNLAEPVKLGLWAQNGRVRIYLNGDKQLDFNQVDLPPITGVELINDVLGTGANSIGYRSVRFAESTPDFSQVITSSGRYVTHGILFDTGSDRLRPESAPVIQSIAKGLQTNPALRLLIEGHTDSAGSAAANLDLSRRRAEAVKSVLVTQFQVDAGRLSATGQGAAKPIDTNDTPQGRAQNRRVELVKQ